MIKHIVLWKFCEEKNGLNKAEIIEYVKTSLLKLPKIIPEILNMEIGKDCLSSDNMSFDMALITVFSDKQDLKIYKEHPEHKKISEFVKSVRLERATVDFEF